MSFYMCGPGACSIAYVWFTASFRTLPGATAAFTCRESISINTMTRFSPSVIWKTASTPNRTRRLTPKVDQIGPQSSPCGPISSWMDLGKRHCLDADHALNAFQVISISPPNALTQAN